jgi:hypothetical protein
MELERFGYSSAETSFCSEKANYGRCELDEGERENSNDSRRFAGQRKSISACTKVQRIRKR